LLAYVRVQPPRHHCVGRGPSIEELADRGDQVADGSASADRDGRLQLRLLAGSRSQDAHELRAGNFVEDELIAELDEHRKKEKRK
jgi:hypothetical protein